MHYLIFDIDGTLVESTGFDTDCYKYAVASVLDVTVHDDWSDYQHVTDSGILNEIIDMHGLGAQSGHIHKQVKRVFIQRIQEHLSKYAVKPVPGAISFFNKVCGLPDFRVAIATGGWFETAKLKLLSAGFDLSSCPVVSSNDHSHRVEIMQLARQQLGDAEVGSVSYFGDASWDKKACEALGWNFIAVGSRIVHGQQIEDFKESDKVMRYLVYE